MIEVDRPEFVERAEQHLDGIADGEMMALKGHLLLEEALYSAVGAKCSNTASLDRADLGFYRLLMLTRALYESPQGDKKRTQNMEVFWDAAEALNTLRNRLAHSLEPTNLAPLLKRLGLPETDRVKPLSDPKVVEALGITVSVLIGYAWGLASKEDALKTSAAPREGN